MEGNRDNQHPNSSESHEARLMASSLHDILTLLNQAPVNPDVPSCTVGRATLKRDGSMKPTPTETVTHRRDKPMTIKISVPLQCGDQHVRLPFVPNQYQRGSDQPNHSLLLSIILIGESTNSVHGGAGFYFQHDRNEDLDFYVPRNANIGSITQSGSISIASGQEGLIHFKFKQYPRVKNEADTAYRILLTLHDSQGDLVSYNLTDHGYRVVSHDKPRANRKRTEADGADDLESTSARKRHRNNNPPSSPPPDTTPDTQVPSSSGTSFGGHLDVPSTTAINPVLVTQNPQYPPAAASVPDISCVPQPPVALGGPAVSVSLPSGNELTSLFPVTSPFPDSQAILTEVIPDRGSVHGGTPLVLFLDDPPEERNIYARFGTSVVTTEWIAPNVRKCIVPSAPGATPGVVDVTLSYGPSLHDPEIGFSISTYTYEADKVKMYKLALQARKNSFRFSGGQYSVNHGNLSAPPVGGSLNGPTYPATQHNFNSRTNSPSIDSHSPHSHILGSDSESEVRYGLLEKHQNDVKMHHKTSIGASTKPLPPPHPKTLPVDRGSDVNLLNWKIRKWLTSIEALSDFVSLKPATPFLSSSLRPRGGISRVDTEIDRDIKLLDIVIDTVIGRGAFTPSGGAYEAIFAAIEAVSRWRSLVVETFPGQADLPAHLVNRGLQRCSNPTMSRLETFKVKSACQMSPLLKCLLVILATTANPGLTTVEVNSANVISFLVPACPSVFRSVKVLFLDISGMHDPVDLLPHLHQLEKLNASHLSLPIYADHINLPFVNTLRLLTLRAVSIQWMSGRIFNALEGCTIRYPLHRHLPHVFSTTLPVCKRLTFQGYPLDILDGVSAHKLNRLFVISSGSFNRRGARQLVWFSSRGLRESRLAPQILHISIEATIQAWTNALTFMPHLEELVIGNARPSSLRAKFLQSLIARPVHASNAGATPTPEEWYPPLCPSLRRFGLKYHRWLRSSEHFDLIPDFASIIFSRERSNFSLRSFWVWMRSDQKDPLELVEGSRISFKGFERLADKSGIKVLDLADVGLVRSTSEDCCGLFDGPLVPSFSQSNWDGQEEHDRWPHETRYGWYECSSLTLDSNFDREGGSDY